MDKRDPKRLLAAAIAALRRDQAHAYEGADPQNATRMLALLWSLSALLTLAFLPLDPPVERIGGFGWVVAGGIVASSFVAAGRLLRRLSAGFHALLALSYLGLVEIGVLVWLSGGTHSTYQILTLFWVCSAMGVHPPRRAFTFLAAAAAVAAATLVYEGWSAEAGAEVAANIMLWAAIGIVMLTLMVTVRGQRIKLREDELRQRELARVDSLTGLGNRRAFDEALAHEVARSQRAGSAVSIVLVDLDGLKRINDGFGHVEGDRCLTAVAEAIRRSIRAADQAFRWGGDEYAVLLPDTDYAGAEVAAATIYAEVMRSCSDARGRPLSVSAGVAEANGEIQTAELIERADMEMMARKRDKETIAAD